ncbi:MAG TPA: hypothetical protein VFM18_13770 [Methanosarcina sp.]|nr:hypothetical protein [Methanosarcina sp.]
MNQEQLKQMVSELKPLTVKFKKDVKEGLLQLYPDYETKEAACMFFLDILEPPKCRFCDNKAIFVPLAKAITKAHIGGWNDVCSHQCSTLKAKETINEKYDGVHFLSLESKSGSVAKRQETTLEKYGVTHISKSKEIQSAKRESIEKKYNGYHYMQKESGSGVREKIQATVASRYGKDFYFQTNQFKEDAKDTMIDRFGVPYAMQSAEIKEKSIKTFQSNYGEEYTNPSHVPEILARIKTSFESNFVGGHPLRDPDVLANRIAKSFEVHGVPYPQQTEEYKTRNRRSRIEKALQDSTNENAIEMYHDMIDHGYEIGILGYLTKMKDSGHSMTRIELANDLGMSPWCFGNMINQFESCRKFIDYKPVRSIIEKKLESAISEFSSDVIFSDRKRIAPKELDIIVDGNIAIEVNGLFYHSELHGGKSNNYHLEKTEACNKIGMKLFHFYDTEVEEKFDIVTGMIRNSSGNTSNKYQARKLDIKEVPHTDYTIFFEENHIQGKINGSVCYGLYDNDTLVYAILFGVPRYAKNYQWEVLRVATKLNSTVAGGFGKVWNHFIQTNQPESVVCYQDRRFGGIPSTAYSSVMQLESKTQPGWWGVDLSEYKVRHRSYYMKHEFSKVDGYDDSKSVTENMIELGHDRIWNCGQYVWSYIK